MTASTVPPQGDYIYVHADIVARVTATMPDDDTLFDLSELFKLFGDSTRIKILYCLFSNEMCVCDIANLLRMSQSAISISWPCSSAASSFPPAAKGKPYSTPWPTTTCAPSWARVSTT